ncbi:heterokaryon incompatibility protein-domain-containing protein [Xylariomycetidae sp. FL2044]|nr:heterokaryon incompatibility protein-domain-containing protein [Xylariomycetidae sp. FL2044]
MSHPADVIPAFRCVDIRRNCLVQPPSGCRYTALSYVWGLEKFFTTVRSNVHQLEKPGALASPEIWDQIPQTIKDAIYVNRELDIPYMWVDSLCIVQDDATDDKIKAIKMMDLVYSAAYLVIVAAGARNAFDGIAGVHEGTRGMQQPVEELAPGFRLAFKSRWQDTLGRSVYETRAWTYQERHFATRALTFLDGQVSFSCQSVSDWQENVFETDEALRGVADSTYDPSESDDIGTFEGLIQAYSERVLTRDADIYNAFAGVAKQLSFRMETNLCHGIPAEYFDWFLLWDSLADQTRRHDAPSWSWSGWHGAYWPHIWDWYHPKIQRVKKAMHRRTWIEWHQRLGHDTEACIPVLGYSLGSALVYGPKLGRQVAVPRRQFQGLDCTQTSPTRKILGRETPVYTQDILDQRSPGSGYLQFWTVALVLRLDTPTSTAEDLGPRRPKNNRLGLFGRSGHELGTVSVQGDWSGEGRAVPFEGEFIMLCEGRDARVEDGNPDDEEGWRYRVMLLDWKGEYAERAAIGSIGKGDLNEALGSGPVWKEIVLG